MKRGPNGGPKGGSNGRTDHWTLQKGFHAKHFHYFYTLLQKCKEIVCSNCVKHLLRTTVLVKRGYLTEWSSIIRKNILGLMCCKQTIPTKLRVLIKRGWDYTIFWHSPLVFGWFLLNWPTTFEIQGIFPRGYFILKAIWPPIEIQDS